MTANPALAPSPRRRAWRRSLGWTGGLALLALTPKCVLCVVAYLGLGAALGWTGPQLCGATTASPPPWSIALAGAGLALLGFALRHRRHRSQP